MSSTPVVDARDRWLPGPGRESAIRRRNYGRTGHGYSIAGAKVIGVTTAIRDGIPSPALVNWAAKTVAEYVASHRELLTHPQLTDEALVRLLVGQPWEERDTAAHRGTEVHVLAEKLLRGEEVEVPEPLRGHVDSYQRFIDEWQPRDVAVEAVVANRTHGWAGTLDYLAELKSLPGLTLLDIKTSRSGIFGETALQLATYASAEIIVLGNREWPMPEVDRALALWVRSDGYDLVPVQIGPEVYAHFRAALSVARRKDALKSYVGDTFTPPNQQPHLEVVAT